MAGRECKEKVKSALGPGSRFKEIEPGARAGRTWIRVGHEPLMAAEASVWSF